jgi:pantoate--beta-alanine ligase
LKVFQTVADLRQYLLNASNLANKPIGFVPTMGALHAGHLSLVQAAKNQATLTVCSIFVNPTQFNDKKDYDKYPMQTDADLEMLLHTGCDVVFVPTIDEMYPNGTEEHVKIDLGFIGTTLEAAQRPGHFEGVVQVVKRLLDIVEPGLLFMGQKDFQQCLVVKKLIDVFEMPVQLVICPTEREADGLAMSSRNMRLDIHERQAAIKLSQALFYLRDHYKTVDFNRLLTEQTAQLNADPLIRAEYLVIVNGHTLEPLNKIQADIPLVALVAAKVGEIRLIDNLVISY